MSSDEIPPPPDDIKHKPSWDTDDKAKKEVEYWPDEDKLRGLARKNQELWVRLLGPIVGFIMVFFSVAFILAFGSWIWHYLTPWSWLAPEQLSKIQSVIFSGVLGGVVSSYAQKHLNWHNRN